MLGWLEQPHKGLRSQPGSRAFAHVWPHLFNFTPPGPARYLPHTHPNSFLTYSNIINGHRGHPRRARWLGWLEQPHPSKYRSRRFLGSLFGTSCSLRSPHSISPIICAINMLYSLPIISMGPGLGPEIRARVYVHCGTQQM